VATKLEVTRWGRAREVDLLTKGKGAAPRSKGEKAPATPPPARVATVEEFAPEYLAKHHEANLCKRSTISTVRMILRLHRLPFIGGLALDQATDEVVADLRAKWTKGYGATRGTT
jgi:hypothetical protein